MSRLMPLICLALMHTLVDTCALLIEPLWPELEVSFGLLSVAALSAAFVIQSMPTSLSQVVFGYLRDRSSSPYLIWVGPLAAAVCLTSIGIAPNTAVLCLLLLVGGIGVGAFHPEAAVSAGRMIPEARTRAMSIFMFGGSLGLALGPALSGLVVRRWGLAGLLYLAPPIIFLIPLLNWGTRLGRSPEQDQQPEQENVKKRLSIKETLEGRIGLAVALLFICSFRLVPNMAMGKVLSFAVDARGGDTAETGFMQSMFLISASVGMFLMAFRFRAGLERTFMIACPLIGIPLMFLLGWSGCPQWLFVWLLVPTGFVLWGTTPAMVSYAQQLFPKGVGLASAITMGFSWGIGGLIQAPITAYYSSTASPQAAFHLFIPFLAFAAVGAWFLPTVVTENNTETTTAESASPHVKPVDA